MIKYFSMFSGIGGFELGIQQAYINWINNNTKERINGNMGLWGDKPPMCIGYSEIDKYAIQIYNKHFKHKNYGDCSKINPEDLPNFDFLVGGFPCQSFSIAGKRGGFDDTRGTLFFEIARIVRKKQPRLLLLENVKGLLSHDKGGTFYTIISTLDELGYDCQWQVLNSKNFGVPQNRERVFIVGHLRGTSRPEVFPIGEDDKIFNQTNKSKKTPSQTSIASTIRTKEGTRADDNFIIINKKGKQKNKNIAATLTGGGHSGGNHSDMDLLKQDAKIRRLTPKECERLQGFPDGWTEYGVEFAPDFKTTEDGKLYRKIKISDTQRYKTLGNAVTVNVVKEIMIKLLNNTNL